MRSFAVFSAAVLWALAFPGGAGLWAAEPASVDGPRISVDEENYSFGRVPQERGVEHVFKVMNTGTKPLVVTRVQTSCGCTAAMMEASVIDPGKTGRLRVSFNPRGQHQVVSRSITIHSNDPERPTLSIKVSAEVVPAGEEKQPQTPVVAKRAHPPEGKLVFEGKCLKCHGPGSLERKGVKLFTSACAACHGEGGRGVKIEKESIGPPLRLATMSVKTQAGLTQVVSAGTGSPAMPGFGKSYGGPLTDSQIASLVQLILKGFPSR